MKVSKADPAIVPNYPAAQEFLRKRNILGLAIVGAGMALTGCNESRDRGRTTGIIACPKGEPPREASTTSTGTIGNGGGKLPEEPPRLPGKVATDPKVDPPARLLGDVMVEPRHDIPKTEPPPALGGVPPVMPPADGR